jgi:hypothetical protein
MSTRALELTKDKVTEMDEEMDEEMDSLGKETRRSRSS